MRDRLLNGAMKIGIDVNKQAQRMSSKDDSLAINNNNKTNAFAASPFNNCCLSISFYGFLIFSFYLIKFQHRRPPQPPQSEIFLWPYFRFILTDKRHSFNHR